MSYYNEWFNNQAENNNTEYFDKYLNLTELQRTTINCLKSKAINFDIYKTITTIIIKQIEKMQPKDKKNDTN